MKTTKKEMMKYLIKRINEREKDGVLKEKEMLETQNDILTVIRKTGVNERALKMSSKLHDALLDYGEKREIKVTKLLE